MNDLTCSIAISITDEQAGTQLNIYTAAALDIEHSWKQMSGTAKITLPKNIQVRGKDLGEVNIEEVIKSGQAVLIGCGYDEQYTTEFVGYVSRAPKPSVPLEIECEDSMYVLKRRQVKAKTFTAGSKLSDLIAYINEGYGLKFATDVLDTELGDNYVVQNGSASKVLKDVEDIFGLKSFFRNVTDSNGTVTPTLVVGKPYSSASVIDLPTKVYVLNGPRGNVKGNNLEYQRGEDKRILVKAICKVSDGKDLKVEVGDSDGDIRTLHYYGVSATQLKQFAEADLARFKTDGYTGSVTGFAVPFVQHGQVVQVVDELYEKRKAEFYVDKVNLRFATGRGFERECTIGWAASGTNKDRIL